MKHLKHLKINETELEKGERNLSKCCGVPMIMNAMGFLECPCTYYAHGLWALEQCLEKAEALLRKSTRLSSIGYQEACAFFNGRTSAEKELNKQARDVEAEIHSFLASIKSQPKPIASDIPETKGEVAVEFPSDTNGSLVEIFYLKDHEPFVCGVYGKVTGDQIAKIERDCAENPGVGFGKGDGQYLFSCHWEPGQYGDEGRCEIAPYWHLDLIAFKPIPLEKPKGGV